MTDLPVHNSRKYGDYTVRCRREVKTIEMTFDEFQRLSFLRPKVRKGAVIFEETEL